MNCAHCGFEVQNGFAFCPKCGSKQPSACPGCGYACEPDFAYCPKCGGQIDAAVKAGPAPSSTIPATAPKWVRAPALTAEAGRVVQGEPHRVDGGANRRTITVLFADLSGFTTMSERLDPEVMQAFQNELFEELTAAVQGFGGFVDKFIGDAMLVVFGLFETSVAERPAAGAAAALRCALGMLERLADLNRTRAAAGREPLEMSIAVHAGEVVAGAVGAPDRHEFTVIGDTVNVAARLQQLCRETGCTLLVSETVYDLARRGGVEAPLAMREPVHVRGRSRPIVVYGLEAEPRAALGSTAET